MDIVNEGVIDISKRTIQQRCSRLGLNCTLAPENGDENELIIVKTDLNFGGDSEWALSDAERVLLGTGPGSDIIWKPSHYRILPRRNVAPEWWKDERLICERYVTNRDDVWYRAFVFNGQLALCELRSSETIKKVNDSTVVRMWRFTINDGVALEAHNGEYPLTLVSHLRRFALDFSLDFGALDAVRDDLGQPYLIDVNSTPAYNHPIPGVVEHLRRVSPGAEALLR